MENQLIDTIPALQAFIDALPEQKGKRPYLYIDLEGNSLSRNGTLSLITMLVEQEKQAFVIDTASFTDGVVGSARPNSASTALEKKVYLIDVTTLQNSAFSIVGSSGRSLRSVLESKDIVKVFFDVRNDSDALFNLYGVCMDGVEDLQLWELATRTGPKNFVTGLAKCIERDLSLPPVQARAWQNTKVKGLNLFDPKRGGSYAVFDHRPLSSDILEYCVQDVVFMPSLRQAYHAKLCDAWWTKIEAETEARVQLSRSASYDPKSPIKAYGPAAWVHWNPSAAERGLRTLFDEDATQDHAHTATASS